MSLDLSKAIEAGAVELDPEAFEVPLRGYGEGAGKQAREQATLGAEDVIRAALPHILEALAEDAKWHAPMGPFSVEVWLRHKAREISNLRAKAKDHRG